MTFKTTNSSEIFILLVQMLQSAYKNHLNLNASRVLSNSIRIFSLLLQHHSLVSDNNLAKFSVSQNVVNSETDLVIFGI